MKTITVKVLDTEISFEMQVEEFQPSHVVEALARQQASNLTALPYPSVEIIES